MRSARLAAAIAPAVVLLAACAAQGGALAFRATGTPRPLPPQGALVAASEAEFEGVLVGLRGRPVVVNVWASWCGPCRAETPLLERAARRYGSAVAFVGVNSRDQADAARDFLRRYHVSYPSLVDVSDDISQRLSVGGLPTTYVFSRTGRVRARVVGGISEQTLAAQVQAALR